MSNGTDDATQSGVIIVGSGIKVPDQLTIGALRALKSASEVWTNLPEPEHADLSEAVGRGVHSLWPFFRSDRPRIDNYQEIVGHLLGKAKTLPSVAYLTQGHPMVLDRVTTELIVQGEECGIPVSVMPGVSSIDTILADIQYEPARGLQVFDATDFVRSESVVDGRAGLLLLQPGLFGVDTPRLTSSAPAPELGALRDFLCKIYSPEHPAVLLRSATASMKERKIHITIGALVRVPPAVLAWTTLWIPPLDLERH